MRFSDVTGQRFGRLIAQWPVGFKYKRVHWLCLCGCGTLKIIDGVQLRSGNVRSCNCLQHEFHRTHGHTRGKHGQTNRRSPEYCAWDGMIQRCTNKKHKYYSYYGGRGIKVCERWLNSFENFLADMGRKPSPELTIDRFPDNNGNYEPGNCRWATRKQQRLNQRPRKAYKRRDR